ncbi:MAG: site-specific DNA-methyltransferase [Ignavibacteriaceae bacterium]|nr:site-specific DNA-methyltransferase [Ignavibacterium sp.]MCC6254993.1 site-specific DNA-methyltransferase [Ignavibacteriaceae bacterium]HRN26437.1 DNA methyltransferase [Ignavibacteriaceae bacterium]HRP92024.1 DNA methyltransferase [Ignavibacteriaceae bacterium]
MQKDLIKIKEASKWISTELKKYITPSNISYLVNYGRIGKHGNNGDTFVSKKEVREYYNSYYGNRSLNWKEKLGKDVDWHLSFENYKESETTKHVHRLHPYKGKFIPQLVEYFLDNNVDEFKKELFFKKGDIVLDPFCGSGTTLVQANELGINAIGIDISQFNSLISNVKIEEYDFNNLEIEINKISESLKKFVEDSNAVKFEKELLEKLNEFNNKYFPSPEYKIKVKNKEINESKYGLEKEKEFLSTYKKLSKEFGIELNNFNSESFLDKWFLKHIRTEIDFVFEHIKKIKNPNSKKVISIILSRTIRSCRATTHSDLATLLEPVTSTYYCSKHGKICKPLFSIRSWWERYSKDTLKRLKEFNSLKTKTFQHCFTGDSQTIDLFESAKKWNEEFAYKLKSQKIKGIFTSPPYVGLINYHEQHAYAYDLYGFKRRDDLEIGPLFKGTGKEARESYIEGIALVLNNCKKFLVNDYNVLIVANDKNNLYPIIAEKAGMKIVQQFKRPVLNRSEKDKNAYSEIIFHLKEK